MSEIKYITAAGEALPAAFLDRMERALGADFRRFLRPLSGRLRRPCGSIR